MKDRLYIFGEHVRCLKPLFQQSRKRTTVLEHSSHRGYVVVDKGIKYNILVYCDPFYEQVGYNY